MVEMWNVEHEEEVKEFVRGYFRDGAYDPSHDFEHVERVVRMARYLASKEQGPIDVKTVCYAAHLHDIGDFKYAQNSSKSQKEVIGDFLDSIDCEQHVKDHVIFIVSNMSFRTELKQQSEKCSKDGNYQTGTIEKSIEFQIVQDADRLDAIGAIGIARCFSFGAVRNRPFYVSSSLEVSEGNDTIAKSEEYDMSITKNTGATLDHFWEKLFHLKDRINTRTAKEIAYGRHEFMQTFVKQFIQECQ